MWWPCLMRSALPTAHYFGYSMGGRIGFALAEVCATHCTSLIIGGAGSFWPPRDMQAPDFSGCCRLREPQPMWVFREQQAAISPALKARVLANDMEACQRALDHADGGDPRAWRTCCPP